MDVDSDYAMSLTFCKFAKSSAFRNKKIPHMMKKLLYLAMALAIVACEKNPEGGSTTPKNLNLTGFAQKGQFVKGSQVTAFAVGSDLVATGESFPANISDDLGAFGITSKTAAPYFDLRAEGYYFNEMKGAVSTSPLYLEAFVKADDTKANINLLTTAIRPRVKKLIKEGKTFDQAVSQAQKELLNSIGFTGSAGNFDDMDITGTTDADGMLLAFACMIQKDRSAAEVTTLIQEIASDLEAKGELTAGVYEKVKSNAVNVNPFAVIQNMAQYYKDKSLSVNAVPPFWKYLDSRYNAPFLVVDHITFPFMPNPGNVVSSPIKSSDAITSGIDVLASIDFSVEVDIQGATAAKEQIFGPAYHVTFQIPANESETERIAHVIFKDASGKVLDQREFEQGANVQYIIIPEGGSTKSDISIQDGTYERPFKEGVQVSVNGVAYTLQRFDNFYGTLGVAVPKADSYIVTYPVGKVSPGEHLIRAKATVNADQTTPQEMYYYGALASDGINTLGNPAQVRMMPCFAILRFKPDEHITHIEVGSIKDYEYFAGTASFVVYKSGISYFPDVNPNIVFDADKTPKISIDVTGSPEYVSCVTFPQHFGALQIKYRVNVNGAVTEETFTTENLTDLEAGRLYSIKLGLK